MDKQMNFTHEVILNNDMGHIKCYGVKLSNSGQSYRIVLAICECYRNTCSCYQEIAIQRYLVKEVIGDVDEPAEQVQPKKKSTLNFDFQYYKGIKLQLIDRGYSKHQMAKRYTLNETNQNVWIPNKHLQEDGTIIEGENIDYVFRKAQNQLRLPDTPVLYRA